MPNDRLIGTVVDGQYRIDERIGTGAVGAVYRATQIAVDRPVALKVLKASISPEIRPRVVERFKREALATSKLRHPNTVNVVDFGEAEDGTLYLVLELLEGQTLARLIAKQAPLAPERVAAIGRQITKSLAEAHERGIIHRDLKPDNVFMCDVHGEADFTKVMDFGIARVLEADDAQVTRTGIMIGTPRYISPEQAMAKKASPAADLYALGVMLYEMLTGKPPFQADSGLALALAHINHPVPNPRLHGIPEAHANAWRGLMSALLQKDHRRRPQQASEVGIWLAQLEHDARQLRTAGAWSATAEAAPPATYEGPAPQPTMTVAKRRAVEGGAGLWVAGLAILFMALGGALAVVLVGTDSPNRPVTPTPSVDATVPVSPAASDARPQPASRTTPTVDASVIAPAEPDAAQSATRLVLTTEPSGATVRWRAQTLCKTPCDVNLPGAGGGARVTVTSDGHRAISIRVPLTGGIVRRQITMEPRGR